MKGAADVIAGAITRGGHSVQPEAMAADAKASRAIRIRFSGAKAPIGLSEGERPCRHRSNTKALS
jgi:hypothetical protein